MLVVWLGMLASQVRSVYVEWFCINHSSVSFITASSPLGNERDIKYTPVFAFHCVQKLDASYTLSVYVCVYMHVQY